MKIHPVGAELFREGELTDNRADMTEANKFFPQFCGRT
jgi:hypothetical protein